MKVWVLCIDNDDGLQLSAHSTEQEAQLELADYCRLSWKHLEDGSAAPLPEDDDVAAIQQYFSSEDVDERAQITECEVS